ncbi:unnamed protein product [Rhizoctonia solani]|uniref:Uncharacterized protein n=1 Tax=Rhizoctonia solani TaxID=456999 RepID=A0A8H3CLJ0_9AGAM|nr:unnamed protein product [Rhizoctonia solani]
MRLFGRKKSTTPEEPPSISRPRAQGHLPPTTAPKSSTSRRSLGSTSGQASGEPLVTPLYARFARADSFENLNLRAKADSRAPSFAPTQQDLEDDAQRLGYDRPWARELMQALDSPEPAQPPPASAAAQTSVRMVSNPSVRDRKTSTDKRVSLEAVAAADPFMASKMQSIMRRAPSNVRVPDNNNVPTPKRSVTAPPTGPSSNPASPPPRVPTAPPTRSVSATGPKSPPSSRPSFDDDETSTFSHSHTGHQLQSRPAYPSTTANGSAKRERGPPPVAGTHSAYAWRSGQSDDGHGGSSNFYTGGSQTNPFPAPTAPSSFALPPGAAPPDPSGRNPHGAPTGLKKRTPSNPPVNRTPVPQQQQQQQGRRMSMDGGNARPLSGGPGTWGGSAIAVPGPGPGPRDRGSVVGPSTGAPSSYGPGPESYGVPGTTYGDLSRAPTVRSVQPGEIFHHPGAAPMPLPSNSSAPYQAVSPPPPPPKSVAPVSRQVPSRQGTLPSPPVPQATQSNQPTPQSNQSTPQPNPAAPRQVTSPAPIATSPHPTKKPTPGLPPGAAPASPTGYKHSPTYSAYGPTPGSAYGSVGANGDVAEGASTIRRVAQSAEVRNSQDVRPQVDVRTSQVVDPKASRGDSRVTNQQLDPRASLSSDFRKSQASDVRTIHGQDQRPSPSSDRPSPTSQLGQGRSSPTKPAATNVPTKPATKPTANPVGASPPKSDSAWSRSVAADSTGYESPVSGRATPVTPHAANLSVQAPDARNSVYSGASSVSVVPPSTPLPPASPSKSTLATPSKSTIPPTTPSKTTAPRSATAGRELPQPPMGRPGPSPLPPSSLREQSIPPRAPSSMSVSSYGTALPLESEAGSEAPPLTKLALGGLAPINTATRSGSPTPTPSSAAPTSAMVTARMTPTTTAALSPGTNPSSTPHHRGLAPPRAVSPTPTTSTTRMDDESDTESAHVKKRNLLVKTRKMDGASSFRSSDERNERPVSVAQPQSPGPGLGLSGGEDPFARAPPTIVKTTKRVQEPAPKRAMPLSPPLSSDDHDTRIPNGLDAQKDDKSPMTPALTDPETDESAEPETTTPPGSPPPPKIYPLETHLNMPSLLAALLPHLSFRDWNALNALNAGLRRQLEDTRALREEILEYWLRGVGYARWKAHKREPLALTLRDLNAYMRGVSIAVYRYSAIAESFLAVRAQQEQTKERVPGAASKGNLVRALASSCRAYTKVILRLREQAEFMHPEGDFRSPLFKAGNAPLLRVFVPSKEGAWLSDVSVLDCEKELKRAGALSVLRIGDVIWDAAVGDEGNAGRMVWDGNYLVDLDYTYSTTGELPKYIHSLAFSPSYWHKIIRTSNSPLCHIDLTPYASEIAANLQLVQDRVQTETPQGGRHTVVRWVHRSRFHTRPGMPIPSASPPAVVDRMWEGYIVVEVEGTNEGLADLQARVGTAVRLFPAKTAGMEFGPPTGKSPFRLLRSMSRPGEIWIRAVREKERLA